MMKTKIPFLPVRNGIFVCPIIAYQGITGGYSHCRKSHRSGHIIAYQGITGGYSRMMAVAVIPKIIAYQGITGGYSKSVIFFDRRAIIAYQGITGGYSVGRKEQVRLAIIAYQGITGGYSFGPLQGPAVSPCFALKTKASFKNISPRRPLPACHQRTFLPQGS